MTGPTFKTWKLANVMREMREAAGKTQKEAASAIDCSPGKITHLEVGRYGFKKSDLEVLLRFYGADENTMNALEELRQGAHERGWWYAYELPEGLASYVGLETAASKVRTVSHGLIHGLLQIEEYARDLHKQGANLTELQIDQRVETRIKRQTRLIGSQLVPQIELHAIMSESAIRILEHTPFAEKQLRKLRERAKLNNVQIQIIPFDAGLHPSMMAGFNILSFPDEQLSDVIYEEDGVGGHIIDEPNAMRRLEATFNRLCNQALSTEDSLNLITETLQKRSKT
jgi:hypothetical protein